MSLGPLQRAAAQLVLDRIDPKQLSAVAIAAASEGADSPALWELAGLAGYDAVEARTLFQRALVLSYCCKLRRKLIL